jgi:hypothetical protein
VGFIADRDLPPESQFPTEIRDPRASGWSIGRFIGCLVGCLVSCLISCLISCSGVEADVLLLKQEAMPPVVTPPDDGPNIPPLPLPLPRRCVLREQGDGRSCQTAETWKWSAQIDCATQVAFPVEPTTGQSKLRLEGLELIGPCGRGIALYFGARYACCLDPNAVVIERPNSASWDSMSKQNSQS